MAVMATSGKNYKHNLLHSLLYSTVCFPEIEGTGLLDTIAGVRNPVGGDLILNGQTVTRNILKPRVAYAQNDSHLCKELTAQQTLRFHYDLKKPTEKLDHLKIDAMDRVCKKLFSYLERTKWSFLLVDKCVNRRSGLGTSTTHKGTEYDHVGETSTECRVSSVA